jgi:hypothetical protein
MDLPSRISGKAVAALLLGLASLGSGFLALVTAFDLFLLGVVAGCMLAILFAALARRDMRHSQGVLQGKALAGWGVGLPVGGVCLGFLLLPVT